MTRPHLDHRLPWMTLRDVIKAARAGDKVTSFSAIEPTPEQLKRVYYFAQCMIATLTEFAATDKASDEEKEKRDPETWGMKVYSHSYFISLYMGYIELNLLLTDAPMFSQLLLRSYNGRLYRTGYMTDMCGDHQNRIKDNHPEWLAEHLRPAFEGKHLKPLTPEVCQLLRDHCAKLFQCMYSLVAPHGKLTPALVADWVTWSFGFGNNMRKWLDEQGISYQVEQ